VTRFIKLALPGSTSTIPAIPVTFEGFGKWMFMVHRCVSYRSGMKWTVTELSTGFAAGHGMTRAAAIGATRTNLKGVGPERFAMIVRNARRVLKKYGHAFPLNEVEVADAHGG
jgi:hypothetical protein